MNRFLIPAAGLVVAAATATVGLYASPQAAPASTTLSSDRGRVGVLCPIAGRESANTLIAAAGDTESLARSTLGEPTKATAFSGTGIFVNPSGPLRVSAPRGVDFSAATGIAARDGAERGLSLIACQAAHGDAWIPGVQVSEDEQAELVLTNLDNTEAAVDVTILGSQGRIAAPGSRGIVVPANSTRAVALSPMVSTPDPVSLRVTTSAGRVTAAVRQRAWRDNRPVGADWVVPAVAPTGQVVIAGVPKGKGRRELVVANPGERTTQIRIDVLGEGGATQIPGTETIEVPAGTTRMVSLERGLLEAPVGLRLTSAQPITAALIAGTGGGDASVDFATIAASSPIEGRGLWPIPVSKDASVVLQLTNATDRDVDAQVTAGSQPQLPIPAGSTVLVEVGKGEAPLVKIEADGPLQVAAVATQSLGKVGGLAVLPLVSGQVTGPRISVRADPHTGS